MSNLQRDGIVIAAAKRLKSKLAKDGFSDEEAVRVLNYVLAEFQTPAPAEDK